MSRWVEGPDVPEWWDGRPAWRWSAFAPELGVKLEYVPHKFSRVREHCEGVYFQLVDIPSPPDTKEQ